MDEKKILVDVWQFLQGIPGHADNYARPRTAAGNFLKHDDNNLFKDWWIVQTSPENWDSKAPSVGTLLAYLETMV